MCTNFLRLLFSLPSSISDSESVLLFAKNLQLNGSKILSFLYITNDNNILTKQLNEMKQQHDQIAQMCQQWKNKYDQYAQVATAEQILQTIQAMLNSMELGKERNQEILEEKKQLSRVKEEFRTKLEITQNEKNTLTAKVNGKIETIKAKDSELRKLREQNQ